MAVCSRVGGSLCVIDRKGQVVKELPKEVSQCSMFSRGMAAFQNDNGSWGYINTSGDTIVPANYSSANMFLYNDYAMVIDENQPNDSTVSFTVINKNGKVMFTANSSEYQPWCPRTGCQAQRSSMRCGQSWPTALRHRFPVHKRAYRCRWDTAGDRACPPRQPS